MICEKSRPFYFLEVHLPFASKDELHELGRRLEDWHVSFHDAWGQTNELWGALGESEFEKNVFRFFLSGLYGFLCFFLLTFQVGLCWLFQMVYT